jgi:ribonuclease D
MTSALEQVPAPYHSFDGDLPSSLYEDFAAATRIAWDIETSGLDWSTDRIALCQLHADQLPVTLIRIGAVPPRHLRLLLDDSSLPKVFHHAMFDLRFMAHHWTAQPRNIACTKIAAKLLFPQQPEEQKLQRLLDRFLGIRISKAEQTSNWFATRYSSSQVAYAVTDVAHLGELFDALMTELSSRGLQPLAEHCFAHLSTRVTLDVGGFGDVYQY